MAADKKTSTGGNDLFLKIENFLSSRKTIFLGVCLGLTALLGFLLFDGRLSFATDDSTYILNALSFLKKGAYPNYQGALYPFFLALLIKLFGVKILVFKTFSMFCLLICNFLFYQAFKGRIPYFIWCFKAIGRMPFDFCCIFRIDAAETCNSTCFVAVLWRSAGAACKEGKQIL